VDQHADNGNNHQKKGHPEKGMFWVTHEKSQPFEMFFKTLAHTGES
jgi:hypothetical protein